ncbi:MAG: hypothetical protein VKK42_24155 [Lyngbya sp.]|nr:hypothetical protein [Lyngbya sp.]
MVLKNGTTTKLSAADRENPDGEEQDQGMESIDRQVFSTENKF